MKSFFLIVGCFFYFQIWSQNLSYKDIDSLMVVLKTQQDDSLKCKNYNAVSRIYLYKSVNEGMRFAKLGMALGQKLNWQRGIAMSHISLGMHLISKGNYSMASQELVKAEAISRQLKDRENLARTFNQLGILKANLSRFPESLDYFFKSLKIFESLKKNSYNLSIAGCYENIGTVYNLNNSHQKAIENYKKAIAILAKIEAYELEYAMNIANLGTIYQKQGKYRMAIATYEIAEKKLLRLQDNFGIAFVNSWLGSAYLEEKQYDISIEKSQKAVSAIGKSGDKELMTTTTHNLGYAQLEKVMSSGNDFELNDAFVNLSTSLKMHLELGNHEGLIKDYLHLSDYYKHKKNFSKSLEFIEKHIAYKDSVFNFKNKQSLQNLDDQRTIDLKNKELQINKLTIESKEKQKWYFIFGILLLGIIGSLLFYQSRNRQKTNEKLQLLNAELDQSNKVKARFFSILNHDLRSPVSNLIHFLHLQKDNPELLDEESKRRMENKTISGAENLLNSMEDILLWSKGQMENFKPQPKKIAIDVLFEDTLKHFESEEKVRITFENPDNLQINTDEDYLKTILRNLTGNAIKALEKIEKPNIIWKAWQENYQTFLSITDNGFGGTQEQFKALYDDKEVVGIKTGLGLHLIRDLAKAIDCEIRVDSKVDEGTTITLKLQKNYPTFDHSFKVGE